jgi:hypothetical protein
MNHELESPYLLGRGVCQLNIWKSGKIDRTVFHQIQYEINSQSLKCSEERKNVSRLLYAVRRGWVSVMD